MFRRVPNTPKHPIRRNRRTGDFTCFRCFPCSANMQPLHHSLDVLHPMYIVYVVASEFTQDNTPLSCGNSFHRWVVTHGVVTRVLCCVSWFRHTRGEPSVVPCTTSNHTTGGRYPISSPAPNFRNESGVAKRQIAVPRFYGEKPLPQTN